MMKKFGDLTLQEMLLFSTSNGSCRKDCPLKGHCDLYEYCLISHIQEYEKYFEQLVEVPNDEPFSNSKTVSFSVPISIEISLPTELPNKEELEQEILLDFKQAVDDYIDAELAIYKNKI